MDACICSHHDGKTGTRVKPNVAKDCQFLCGRICGLSLDALNIYIRINPTQLPVEKDDLFGIIRAQIPPKVCMCRDWCKEGNEIGESL